MIFVKNLAKENVSFRLKHKENLDFIIITSLITLLTMMGIFMSHYNKNTFMGGIKQFHPIVISTFPSNMAVNVDVSKKFNTIFIVKM